MILRQDPFDLDTPTGPMRTYLYRPVAEGKFPAVVLFSEIYQRTGPIHRTAAMLAGHGYLVAVPDVYHDLLPPGTELPYDPEGTATGNRCKTARPIAAFDDDARAAVAFLQGHEAATGKVGAMGMCLGGHLAFRAAMLPQLLATACFYATDIHKGSLGSGGDDSMARMADIRGELLMIWGRQDPHVPDEGRAAIQARLTEVGARFTWHEFNAAHAFMRDEGPRYDPALALVCWRLVLELFRGAMGA